jgi:hypothetical protein
MMHGRYRANLGETYTSGVVRRIHWPATWHIHKRQQPRDPRDGGADDSKLSLTLPCRPADDHPACPTAVDSRLERIATDTLGSDQARACLPLENHGGCPEDLGCPILEAIALEHPGFGLGHIIAPRPTPDHNGRDRGVLRAEWWCRWVEVVFVDEGVPPNSLIPACDRRALGRTTGPAVSCELRAIAHGWSGRRPRR